MWWLNLLYSKLTRVHYSPWICLILNSFILLITLNQQMIAGGIFMKGFYPLKDRHQVFWVLTGLGPVQST